jgi:hypothetical protein
MGPALLALCLAAQTVTFSTLRIRGSNQVAEPSAYVIRDGEAWNRFLRGTLGVRDAPPRVDFNRSLVVAIFAGEQRTGGYSVTVERVTEDSRPGEPARGIVHYRIVSPPPDAFVTQALTYPYTVVRIDKRFESVAFQPEIPVKHP